MTINAKYTVYLGILISYVFMATACTENYDGPSFSPVDPDVFKDAKGLSNSWGDYDGDGDLDLVISFGTGSIRLYKNDEGRFTNIGADMGFPTDGKDMRSVAWGDYNADGYLDLYAGSLEGANELYRNDNGSGFTKVGADLGVDIPHVSARQISWIDYDRNGTVDLFVADRRGANYLFRNDNGIFQDVSDAIGLADERPTVGACWFDYDGDGLHDLFLANQSGTTDALYKNEDGIFRDVAPELGMEGDKRADGEGGVDCTVGDYDNDGDFDLFVATYGRNYLYRNEGSGEFKEVSEEMGIEGDDHMVASSWADYDNDGYLDLYVAGYVGPSDNREPYDRLFHNNGVGFDEINIKNSPLNGADHGVQWADFDQDGDLDVSLTEGYNINGHHPLLRNELGPERAKASIQIKVLDKTGLPSRAGAEVRLYDESGMLLGTRLVSTGGGYNGQSNIPVHFGLQKLEKITVEVTFFTESGRNVKSVAGVDPADYVGGILTIQEE